MLFDLVSIGSKCIVASIVSVERLDFFEQGGILDYLDCDLGTDVNELLRFFHRHRCGFV